MIFKGKLILFFKLVLIVIKFLLVLLLIISLFLGIVILFLLNLFFAIYIAKIDLNFNSFLYFLYKLIF